jgi:hypothetical protein
MDPVDVAGVPFRAVPASSEEFMLKDDFGLDDVPTVTASRVFTIEMVSPEMICPVQNFCEESELPPLLTLSSQKEGPVSVFHVTRGVPMRIDDHDDLVFSIRQYSLMGGKFAAAKKDLDERFPGNTVTTKSTMKQFIMDFLARALWPWRTIFVITNPERKGGRMPMFNKIRFDALDRKFIIRRCPACRLLLTSCRIMMISRSFVPDYLSVVWAETESATDPLESAGLTRKSIQRHVSFSILPILCHMTNQTVYPFSTEITPIRTDGRSRIPWEKACGSTSCSILQKLGATRERSKLSTVTPAAPLDPACRSELSASQLIRDFRDFFVLRLTPA